MKLANQYDELEFERLVERLTHQRESAFFCVTFSASISHTDFAERMCEKLPSGKSQIIDFRELYTKARYSSELIKSLIKDDTFYVFLANFQLACGDMPDAEFFQIFNLSRDTLAELPVVFVFMMPLYFRINIARSAPDFNTFFIYRADFVVEIEDSGLNKMQKIEAYNESNSELIEYYLEKYNKLRNHESKEAFEIIIYILILNVYTGTLSFIESKRLYESFVYLSSLYHEKYIEFDVAYIFLLHGDFEKALELYNEELRTYEGVNIVNCNDIANIYNNIGLIYVKQGKLNEALDYYNKALDIEVIYLEKEHIDIAFTYNNIAEAYDEIGEYDKALEFLFKALNICENVYGKEHPSTACVYNDIARVYSGKKEYTGALEWYNKAKKSYEITLGFEHPDTATVYSNKADTYSLQGDYINALKYFKKALDIREKKLGKKHSLTKYIYKSINKVEALLFEADKSKL